MELRGKRVLVMGLGLQGSGMASARYAAQQGALVRVTDMKSAQVLEPSVRALSGLPIEFVLGQHRDEDFVWADIVIRNPGVSRTSRSATNASSCRSTWFQRGDRSRTIHAGTIDGSSTSRS